VALEVEENNKVNIADLNITLEWVKEHAPQFLPELPDQDKLQRKLLGGKATQEFQEKYQAVLDKITAEYLKWKEENTTEPTEEKKEQIAVAEKADHSDQNDLIMMAFLSVPVDIRKVKFPGIPDGYDHSLIAKAFVTNLKIEISEDNTVVPLEIYNKIIQ
jgi:hypothetical protein